MVWLPDFFLKSEDYICIKVLSLYIARGFTLYFNPIQFGLTERVPKLCKLYGPEVLEGKRLVMYGGLA